MSTTHSTVSTSVHLRLDGISKTFLDQRVLTDISFVVPSGSPAGLIGENGSGKSTLLRIAAGLIEADAGAATVVGASGFIPRVGLLHQAHAFAEGDTVASALETAIAPVHAAAEWVDRSALRLGAAPEDPAVAEEYARALEEAERLSAWDIDARVSAMLAGLGLSDLSPERPVQQLSGGQRARLALAWLLLSAPDVLLLDEPTNHLDDGATEHLRRVLMNWQGPVLFASHDRAFLDETATSLIDLDPTPIPHSMAESLAAGSTGAGIGTTHFTGSYSDYLLSRADARARWELRFRDEQAELKRLSASVRGSQTVGHDDWKPRTETRMAQKFYADRNAKVVARRVNDARSRLEDLEQRQVRKPPAVLKFVGLAPVESWPQAAQAEVIPDAPVSLVRVAKTGRLAPISLSLSAGEKLLVTGANGAGKSTLLHLIAGRLDPSSGSLNAPARIGMLTQDVSLADPFGRGAERTARQAYIDLVGEQPAEALSLAAFGLLSPRDENRPLAHLSLGQQRRLELAVVLANPPEVLLLDEPTNHLSLLLATELEAAIPEYPGTVIIASHDRWLRRRWAGRHIELSRVSEGSACEE